ncbi:hypothetical protein [Deinococcus hopiensis]|uniref:DUF2846 domain-containing protein n=1 Tax=Deinococcus hopiensis KR-140 TaxID=695939 RepID=A0A1W1VML1_9DEIO|nr:hypothetical protein [Deinococcus hopiensis]SMB94597.1 hypothetical protein SAMN00790413_02451 [Deinococcus hopiensis KR-140]
MPTFNPRKALLLTALFAATTAGLPASAAPVYFDNDSGASGVVDVYVDGQLVFDDVFADSAMMFPRELARGKHEVVVTPFYLKLGQGDVMRASVNVSDDRAYTLRLAPDKEELALKLSAGHQPQQ